MANKNLDIPKHTKVEVKRVGQLRATQDESKIPFREGDQEIAPPGWKRAIRKNVYLYQRDLDILKEAKSKLRDLFGDIGDSELIRFALNTMNIDRYKSGY
jgi:hypothetical protein